jgi:hypothetical protein
MNPTAIFTLLSPLELLRQAGGIVKAILALLMPACLVSRGVIIDTLRRFRRLRRLARQLRAQQKKGRTKDRP